MARIKIDLERSVPGINVTPASREGQDAKINCQLPGAQIKIEVNTITRGNINPTQIMRVHNTVEEIFGRFAAIQDVSMAELYGGKICAALDRQHPRDLFDVRLLLDNEGFSDDIKLGFLVALISHMRPISEVVNPIFIDQRQAFDTQFSGMANIPFTYDDYERTRIQLVKEIHSMLTEENRSFLLSFKEGIPDWEKFSVKDAKELPAVQWKLHNIRRLKQANPEKHTEMLKILEKNLLR